MKLKTSLFLHTCAGPNSAEIKRAPVSVFCLQNSAVSSPALQEELQLLKYHGDQDPPAFPPSKMIPPFM